jgi:S-DNA-T family DNA segregation ATPase FtsK/SpoIIIE
MTEKAKAKDGASANAKNGRVSEFIGLGLFAAGLFMTLSIFSWYPNDPPAPTVFPDRVEAVNKCGMAGSLWASVFFKYFGVFCTYIFAGAVIFWGLKLLFNKIPALPLLKIAAWFFVFLGVAALESLLLSQNAFEGRISGGLIGTFMSENALQAHFNFTGSFIIAFFAVLASFLVATDIRPSSVMAGGGWLYRHVAALVMARGGGDAAVAELPVKREEKPPKPETKDEPPEPDKDEAAAIEERKKRIEAILKEKERLARNMEKEAKNAKKETIKENRKDSAGYVLPPIDLLEIAEKDDSTGEEAVIAANSQILEKKLEEFGIGAQVVNIERGPVVTLHELKIATGIKVSKVHGYSDDLAMAVRAESVRIATMSDKGTVGVEIPRKNRRMVRLREILEKSARDTTRREIPIFLGQDTKGKHVVSDLTKLPHLLIAGSTGSGKSVCMNSIILSILYTKKPDEVKLLLVDPKRVEFSAFEHLPHLLHPVVTDMKKAQAVLEWAVKKMEDRYILFEKAGARSIQEYNVIGKGELERRVRPKVGPEEVIPWALPYIVIVVDELADLMLATATREIEMTITRLAQKSRAVGIHLILATQRPSVDVITGLIKGNMPSRIAFQVASMTDSRTILDHNGADKLLRNGDMLFLHSGSKHLIRAQGALVVDKEIIRTTEFIKKQALPEYNEELAKWEPAGDRSGADLDGGSEGRDISPLEDPEFIESVEVFLDAGRASTTLLQNRLSMGYAHAARIVEQMAQMGIVSNEVGAKGRQLMIKRGDWEEMISQLQAAAKTKGAGGNSGNADAGKEEDGE